MKADAADQTPMSGSVEVRTPAPPKPKRARRKRGGSQAGTPIRGLLLLAVGLGAWQLLGDPSSPYFPPPSKWWTETYPLVTSGEFLPALRRTAITFVVGLAIATVIGSAIGILVGSSRLADRALGPGLEFMRILPAAALVPVVSLILGYNLQMELFLVTMIATWPILLICRSERRSLSPVLLDVPRTLGLTRWERFSKILLPAMTRPILLGVRVAAPLALIITILVEIITHVPGIGALIGSAQANYRSAQVWGLLVVTGVLGYLLNWCVTKLEVLVSARFGALR